MRRLLFTNVPNPIEIAKRLEQSDDEDGDISKYDPCYKV